MAIEGIHFFITLDLPRIYNLIFMKEDHEYLTAFDSCYRKFAYIVMIFGGIDIVSVPEICESYFSMIFKTVLDYGSLDNLLIYFENVTSTLIKSEQFFNALNTVLKVS